MKTIREMAKICGVSEQAIRGWCRRNYVAKDAKGSFLISETIESSIYRHYKVNVAKDVSQLAKADNAVNKAVIELLRKELESKNKQIDELNKRLMECQKLLDQEQKLSMVVKQEIVLREQQKGEEKYWWKFWK